MSEYRPDGRDQRLMKGRTTTDQNRRAGRYLPVPLGNHAVEERMKTTDTRRSVPANGRSAERRPKGRVAMM